MFNTLIDMTGWVMSEHGVPDSKLTVIRRIEDYVMPSGKHKAMWLCSCSCNECKQVAVTGQALRNGRVKSCGCLKRENGIKKRKYNKYDIHEEEQIVEFFLEKGGSFIVDLQDFDIVNQYYWRIDTNGYIFTKEYITGKTIRLHSMLCPDFIEVDHIDKNKMNNRRSNFREVSRQENVINRPLSRNNDSGFTGVYWSKKDQSWYSQITINKKRIHLEYTNTKEDAIVQRLRAELKYFGAEFAPQRHLFEQYGINVTAKGENKHEL